MFSRQWFWLLVGASIGYAIPIIGAIDISAKTWFAMLGVIGVSEIFFAGVLLRNAFPNGPPSEGWSIEAVLAMMKGTELSSGQRLCGHVSIVIFAKLSIMLGMMSMQALLIYLGGKG